MKNQEEKSEQFNIRLKFKSLIHRKALTLFNHFKLKADKETGEQSPKLVEFIL